jgi:D-aminopeptidase
VLVQSNFGGQLAVDGVPVWRELRPPERLAERGAPAAEHGSCMIVVATDAPLDARELRRLAARAMHGMARTGASGSHGSGDYAIAFSTAGQAVLVEEDTLSPLFQAVIEATEEAILNSLLKAETVRGRGGHVAEAIPIERLREVLRRSGRLP